jgi:hypothetical protein
VARENPHSHLTSCSFIAATFANKYQDLIRISVGTEHIDDIIADFEQSFKSAAAAKTSGGKEENATATGSADSQAKLEV